jgi:hypothetical protein
MKSKVGSTTCLKTKADREILDSRRRTSVNEILRTLVAKHNLPPYQNEDGTYPFPTAANPFAYPVFPFANPPYAARAYKYVATAQYDAYGNMALQNCTTVRHLTMWFKHHANGSCNESAILSLRGYSGCRGCNEMLKLCFPLILTISMRAAEQLAYHGGSQYAQRY